MKLIIVMLFCVVYCGQQADGRAGAQSPMRGNCSYLPLDEILPLPGEDTINHIGEESNDDGEMWHLHPRSILMSKTGFQ